MCVFGRARLPVLRLVQCLSALRTVRSALSDVRAVGLRCVSALRAACLCPAVRVLVTCRTFWHRWTDCVTLVRACRCRVPEVAAPADRALPFCTVGRCAHCVRVHDKVARWCAFFERSGNVRVMLLCLRAVVVRGMCSRRYAQARARCTFGPGTYRTWRRLFSVPVSIVHYAVVLAHRGARSLAVQSDNFDILLGCMRVALHTGGSLVRLDHVNLDSVQV